LARYRLFQQLRLWLYMAMFVAAVAMIGFGDGREAAAGLLAVSAMILFNLETCPTCGRRVWREGEGVWTSYIIFPVRAFWIGRQCREPGKRRGTVTGDSH